LNLTDLVEVIKESLNKGPKPYDTTAEVVRIEDETAWVQIPGSDDETPVNLTIAAKVGDNVQVRVSGGNAFLVGNATAPPTDDTTAIKASAQSEEADAKATEALDLASNAYSKTTTVEQEFAAAVININTDIADLQNQIDGNITTWFYAYVPTTSNAPANTWTTTEDKNNHLGDLFYDTSTGYAYRWMLEDNTYSWSRITDTDVAEALAAAAQAQDTADSKRRVFIVEPTAPYDVGDIWFQGATGDILVCTNARASIIVGSAVVGMTVLGNSAYSSSDWEKRNKYTDDTVANQAKTIADNTAQYFWVNSTGTDTGAHITEVTQDDWNNSSSPNYHSGGNLLARSNGIAVRNGMTELATFSTTTRIGQSTDENVEISSSGILFNDGSTNVAKIHANNDVSYLTLDNENITVSGSHADEIDDTPIDALNISVLGRNNNRYAEIGLRATGKDDQTFGAEFTLTNGEAMLDTESGFTFNGDTIYHWSDLMTVLTGLLLKGEETSDLDNCTTTGFYTYSSAANHKPVSSAGGSLLVLRSGTNNIYQVAFANTSASFTASNMQIHARRYYSGTWDSNWYKFSFS